MALGVHDLFRLVGSILLERLFGHLTSGLGTLARFESDIRTVRLILSWSPRRLGLWIWRFDDGADGDSSGRSSVVFRRLAFPWVADWMVGSRLASWW
jgi:hypothetical protein